LFLLIADDLASLFQAISLSDYMYFSKLGPDATADEVTCSDTSLAVDDSNLVVKAMSLMRRKTGIKQFFRIFLDKNVPMQAGLGGGSGNAATAMHAFNLLSGGPQGMSPLNGILRIMCIMCRALIISQTDYEN
jgi:4-diphosphocytidyl-2-C-methyl-D-erythritol kinase